MHYTIKEGTTREGVSKLMHFHFTNVFIFDFRYTEKFITVIYRWRRGEHGQKHCYFTWTPNQYTCYDVTSTSSWGHKYPESGEWLQSQKTFCLHTLITDWLNSLTTRHKYVPIFHFVTFAMDSRTGNRNAMWTETKDQESCADYTYHILKTELLVAIENPTGWISSISCIVHLNQ